MLPPANGSVSFTILNMRTPMQFIYISGDQYPEVKAQSKTVNIADPDRPVGGRLSLVVGDDFEVDSSKMRLMWHAGGANDSCTPECSPQQIIFGTSSGQYTQTVKATTNSRPYSQSDMCDMDVHQ